MVVDNLGILRGLNVEIIEAPTPYDLLAHQEVFHPWAEVIIDAIIGTGLGVFSGSRRQRPLS
ncbi:hypothetical protein [Vulcanisaeta sp. JCM 16161]|uniref:hypothetical protein n=1 Tax=Vulcanisaeta sp. JCM 16161 TaxID=1295372 RepID=UPI001FB4C035|nr:hypothetical protein [Vulcanisaeta sp. JCM 16161]